MQTLNSVKIALEKNNITTYIVNNKAEAKDKIANLISPGKTIGLGGSKTVTECGILEMLIKGNYTLFNQYDPSLSQEEQLSMRKKGLTADYFITGTNAITQKGELVNCDGFGNRVAAMIFGPDKVIIVVGKNKIVADINKAFERIQNWAAPLNAKRFELKTPCVTDKKCNPEICNPEYKFCNIFTIIKQQKTKERMTLILVNEDLGF